MTTSLLTPARSDVYKCPLLAKMQVGIAPWGSIETEAKVTWDIRQGVLAAAGGFGNHFGLEGDPNYPQFHGFNTNVLVPPNTACKWTATPPLKYVKATISKVFFS